jgi:hypothetical protein
MPLRSHGLARSIAAKSSSSSANTQTARTRTGYWTSGLMQCGGGDILRILPFFGAIPDVVERLS